MIGHVICEQLRVQLGSSSVRQEVVSTVMVSVTHWSTAPMPLMKPTVVSESLISNTGCNNTSQRLTSVFSLVCLLFGRNCGDFIFVYVVLKLQKYFKLHYIVMLHPCYLTSRCLLSCGTLQHHLSCYVILCHVTSCYSMLRYIARLDC